MKVLSLFDGISCGRIALERAGIEVDRYIAFEIDDNAIKISKNNWNDIEYRGDVFNADFSEFEGFDLLIGGSPCQNLSMVNIYDRSGLEGMKSRLFWEFKRALDECKPKYFLFENVASMKNIDKQIITDALGTNPIKIDSQVLSAQKRNRLYWTNINFEAINERKINYYMQDILEKNVDDKYYLKEGTKKCIMSPPKSGKWQCGKFDINLPIARPVLASCWKIHRADTDNYVTDGYIPNDRSDVRRLTPLECERLQTLPDNYTEGVKDKERYIAIGNGWTVDVIAHILRRIK